LGLKKNIIGVQKLKETGVGDTGVPL